GIWRGTSRRTRWWARRRDGWPDAAATSRTPGWRRPACPRGGRRSRVRGGTAEGRRAGWRYGGGSWVELREGRAIGRLNDPIARRFRRPVLGFRFWASGLRRPGPSLRRLG